MGYLDDRATSFRNITEIAPQVAPLKTSEELTKKAKFRRIVFAVTALGIVAGMQHVDKSFFKRKVTIVAKDEFERSEPSFFEKMFCRGNRVPKFCNNSH